MLLFKMSVSVAPVLDSITRVMNSATVVGESRIGDWFMRVEGNKAELMKKPKNYDLIIKTDRKRLTVEIAGGSGIE